MARVAIVGAGLAGLTLAHRLAPKHTVTVYEKSRGPGGRMATRYAGAFEFDHGAQYFTARTRAFREFLEPLIGEGLITPWRARCVEISPTGAVIQRAWDESEPRYVGVPRMNVFGKALAGGLDIRFGTAVERVERSGTGWRLLLADTPEPVDTDWLLVTTPLPQAKALLADVEGFGAALGERQMLGCFSLMLGFESPPAVAFDAALVYGADIRWIAVNSSKPGRGPASTMVVHAANRWTDANIEVELDAVRGHMLNEVHRVIGIRAADAVHQDIHRWRFANAVKADGASHFLSPRQRLGVAGDGWLGGKVESAFTSADGLSNDLEAVLGQAPAPTFCANRAP